SDARLVTRRSTIRGIGGQNCARFTIQISDGVTMRSFFSELKRRHVDKVALLYAVVAWLLIEVASILLPTLEAPAWMLTAFVLLLALGFALAVFVSWNFEMTPEG